MSYIADLILTEFDSEDDACPAVLAINDYLMGEYKGAKFTRVDQSVEGPRCMKSHVWIAAVNYLDVEELECLVRQQQWEYPEEVQLLIKNEHDDRFGFLIKSLVPEEAT